MTHSSHMISLTFDDALDVHLDRVVPLLDQRGMKGTFFVTLSAPAFGGRLDAWRAVASSGHELGNHTIFHPATLGKSYVSEGNAIENYTLDRMRLELEGANRMLAGLDGQTRRTFAYPCCNPVLGRPGCVKRLLRHAGLERTRFMGLVHRHSWLDVGSAEVSYEPLAAELFLASRVGGESFCAGSSFPPRLSSVPSVTLDGKTVADIEGLLDKFMRHDQAWLTFMAHGVGDGHRLCCDETTFESLLDLLCRRGLQVVTFRDAALAVLER